ncbi:MAG: hypothetical protein FWC89_03900 [Defluviitaleaceae bacterium]|nr:hypothetical protein [Defluviitaleaceae bacterium]
MYKTIFDDPEFIKALNKNVERVRAIAEAENRDVLEVIESDINNHLENLVIVINEGTGDIKKSNVYEKYNILSIFDWIAVLAKNMSLIIDGLLDNPSNEGSTVMQKAGV